MVRPIYRIASIVVIAISFLFALHIIVYAAEITYDVKTKEIVITGTINVYDDISFFGNLYAHPETVGVRLESSPGGNMVEAMSIGGVIYARKLYTFAKGYCNSACAYIWIAGENKYYASETTMIQHLPNKDGKIDFDAISLVSWYIASVGGQFDFLHNILEFSGYEANHPFDFIPLVAIFYPDNVKMVPND